MSNNIENWTQWLKNGRFSYMTEQQQEQTINWLLNVRNNLLEIAQIQAGETIIDIGTGTGLLAFGVYELFGDSCRIIASDHFTDCLEECQKVAQQCNISIETMQFKQLDASNINLPDNCVDVILMRSVLVHILDKQPPINEFFRILKPGGRLCFYEPIISSNTRYNELVDMTNFSNANRIIEAEEFVMTYSNDPITNFTLESIQANLQNAGFEKTVTQPVVEESSYPVREGMVDQWFSASPSPGSKSMKDRLLEKISENEFNDYKEYLEKNILYQDVNIKTYSIYSLAQKV